MKQVQKVLILLVLLFWVLLPEIAEPSFRDYQVTRKALSDNFYGLLHGAEAIAKGLWGLTTNTGKLLWQGSRDGYQKSKISDRWLQERLW